MDKTSPAGTGERLSRALVKRVNDKMAHPYTEGIWEGRHFCRKPFVTIRLEDLEAILGGKALRHDR